MAKLRVYVCVGGFNLYYRALKPNRCNWLDLDALARLYLPQYEIQNDTDLEEPLRVVKEEMAKGVALLHPSKYASGNLGKYATTVRKIRSGALRQAQFADELTDSVGVFRKPASW